MIVTGNTKSYIIYIYIYISIYKLLSNYSHFFRFYYRGSMIPILRNERLGICMFHGTIRCGSHHLVSFTYTRHFVFIRHGDSHTHHPRNVVSRFTARPFPSRRWSWHSPPPHRHHHSSGFDVSFRFEWHSHQFPGHGQTW